VITRWDSNIPTWLKIATILALSQVSGVHIQIKTILIYFNQEMTARIVQLLVRDICTMSQDKSFQPGMIQDAGHGMRISTERIIQLFPTSTDMPVDLLVLQTASPFGARIETNITERIALTSSLLQMIQNS
jgi:hypothetical protein